MSDCTACIYVGDDYEMPDFYNAKMVRARKVHKCIECGVQIQVGGMYERVSGKWDGRMDTFHTCAICQEIRQAFCCDGWIHGSLWDDAVNGEFFEAMTTGCLAKLTTAAAKDNLLQRWRDWKDI